MTAAVLAMLFLPGFLAAAEMVPVGKVAIVYTQIHAQHPSAEDLLGAKVRLVPAEGGYTAAKEGDAAETVETTIGEIGALSPAALDLDGVRAVSQAVVDALNARGLVGVYVRPHEEDLAVQKGKMVDKRNGGTDLRLAVDTAVVCEVRTVGSGERMGGDGTRVNNPIHQRIARNSPLAPGEEDAGGDLIWRQQLDNYLLRLNRHPGRRVEGAISAAEKPGTVTLDYLVAESKPWTLYAQVSNTGTETTDEWRERIGFIHRQLTGHDDILSIDYVTTDFGDAANSVQAAYEFPLLGVGGRLRGKIFGAYSEYSAADVGVTEDDWEGESWQVGAELAFTLLQVKTLFVDAVAGVRFQNESTTNLTQAALAGGLTDTFYEGDTDFLVAYGGLRLERHTDFSSTDISVMVETSCPNLVDTDEVEANRLGRLNVDTDWTLLRWNARHSFHVESLLALTRDDAYRIPETNAHEIVLRCTGQHVFGDERLPAQFQDVVGGLFTVRGYRETAAAGDDTVVASAEYCLHTVANWGGKQDGEGWPVAFGLRRPGRNDDLVLTWRAFFDMGRTRIGTKTVSDRDTTMMACGAGLEARIRRNLSLRCDWGYVLRDIEDADGNVEDDAEEGDQRFHFMATFLW